MTDDWEPYLTNVNGELASILVNLGLRSIVPITNNPWLLWIWVYFRSPRPDGLSSNEEASTLYAIEDAILAKLDGVCSSIHCGRITTAGRREFYIYAAQNLGLDQTVKDAMRAFPQYQFDIGLLHEDNWNQYLNVLYPSQDQMESIQNRKVLDVMSREGDIHSEVREVSHWLYFPSEPTRIDFMAAALAAGYPSYPEPPSSKPDDRPFGVVIQRTQSVEQKQIDTTVRELRALADPFDGDYDGWEAQVTTASDTAH